MPSISQHGWGAVLFVGLGAICVVVLVISAGAVAWRLFNPLPQSRGPRDERSSVEAEEFAKIWAKLSDQSATMYKLLNEYSDMHSKEVARTDEKIEEATAKIREFYEYARRDNEALAQRVFALRAFNELSALKREIDRLASLLERPLKATIGERDWSNWDDRFARYQKAVHRFSDISRAYYPNEADGLTHLNPNLYRVAVGDFAPENFPSPQTAHDFKSYRQMQSAFENLAVSVIERIEAKS